MCGTHTTTPRWLHGTRHAEVLRVCSVCCGGFPYTDVITRLYNIFTYAHTIVKHIFTPRLIYACPIQLFFSRSSTCIQVDNIQPIIDRFQKLTKGKLISTYRRYVSETQHGWVDFDINLVKMFFSFLQKNFRHEKVSVCKCFSVYLLVYK